MCSGLQALQHAMQTQLELQMADHALFHAAVANATPAQQGCLWCGSRQLSGCCCAKQPSRAPAEAVLNCIPICRPQLHNGTTAWALSRVGS